MVLVGAGSRVRHGQWMDYALMMAATALGVCGAPVWTLLVICVLLTACSFGRSSALARRFNELGAARVFAVSIGAHAANNAAFAAMAFALGRVGAWLLVQ